MQMCGKESTLLPATATVTVRVVVVGVVAVVGSNKLSGACRTLKVEVSTVGQANVKGSLVVFFAALVAVISARGDDDTAG